MASRGESVGALFPLTTTGRGASAIQRHNGEGVGILLLLATPMPRLSVSGGARYLSFQKGQVGVEGGREPGAPLGPRPSKRGQAEGYHDPVPPSVARNLSHPPYLGSQFCHRRVQERVSLSCCPSPQLHRRGSLPGCWKKGLAGGGGRGEPRQRGCHHPVSHHCKEKRQRAWRRRPLCRAHGFKAVNSGLCNA